MHQSYKISFYYAEKIVYVQKVFFRKMLKLCGIPLKGLYQTQPQLEFLGEL